MKHLPFILLFRSLSRNDLVEYVKTHYGASRMVLAAAGGVKHEDLVKLAETHLGSLSGSLDTKIPLPTHCRFTGN